MIEMMCISKVETTFTVTAIEERRIVISQDLQASSKTTYQRGPRLLQMVQIDPTLRSTEATLDPLNTTKTSKPKKGRYLM